jgi:hypothetical protein
MKAMIAVVMGCSLVLVTPVLGITVTGTVIDNEGMPVADAQIAFISEEDTLQVFSDITASDGSYIINSSFATTIMKFGHFHQSSWRHLRLWIQ